MRSRASARRRRWGDTLIDRALPRRVLLFEHDAPMRNAIRRALRRAGFDVVDAASGNDGLEILAASIGGPFWFDAVVSDVRAPGDDGLNLVVHVRRLPRLLPAIVITAFGTKELHEAALRRMCSARSLKCATEELLRVRSYPRQTAVHIYFTGCNARHEKWLTVSRHFSIVPFR